jgi:transposase
MWPRRSLAWKVVLSLRQRRLGSLDRGVVRDGSDSASLEAEHADDGVRGDLAAAPRQRSHPKGGRPWIEDRAVLGGVIYVLRAGVPWRLLPARELGCGSGVTCWRRLRDWQQAGVWEQLHHRLLDWLGDDGQVDWSRAAIDSVSVRARRGGR